MTRHILAITIALLVTTTSLFGQRTGAGAGELIVKAAAADVHKFPSIGSAIIAKAPGGTVLEIRRNLGSWVEVSWPNTEVGVAFVHVNTGTIVARPPSAAPNGAQQAIADIAGVAAASTAAAGTGQRAAMPQGGARPADYGSLPPRRFGMGVVMNTAKPEFGASARMWWAHHLGVQFSAARPQIESADGLAASATRLAPSVLYSLPDGITSNLWLRPYIGAGPRLYRTNFENHLGYEGIGGVEATFAAMPQFTVSAELGYRGSRPSINAFEPRQVSFALSGLWYVK